LQLKLCWYIYVAKLGSNSKDYTICLSSMAIVTKARKSEVPFPLDVYPNKSISAKSSWLDVPALPDIPLPPPSRAPDEVLSLDRETPDHHVPRDQRLIRLTGVHPFNAEAPLTDLFNEGVCFSESRVKQ
jgi:hypothetical protein